jgi:hypothetical protein
MLQKDLWIFLFFLHLCKIVATLWWTFKDMIIRNDCEMAEFHELLRGKLHNAFVEVYFLLVSMLA